MRQTFDDFALEALDESEGGYVNHPLDPGGHTNRGITLRTYRSVMGDNATVDDLKRITDEEVAHIYRQRYWLPIKGDQLPAGVDYCVFDYAVNSGPRQATKTVQRVVGAKPDGAFGPRTLTAVTAHVNRHGTADLIEAICDRRLAFMQRLKTWSTFKRGWKARVQRVREDSLMLASDQEEMTRDELIDEQLLRLDQVVAGLIALIR
jgi:lysozyme family protein